MITSFLVDFKDYFFRVVNGTEANPESHPWLVSIYIGKDDPYPACGGVLISNLHVLTVAHCIKSNVFQKMSLVVFNIQKC